MAGLVGASHFSMMMLDGEDDDENENENGVDNANDMDNDNNNSDDDYDDFCLALPYNIKNQWLNRPLS